MAGSGTMVSAAVLSALPVELPPLLLEMLLVSELASALALSELVLDDAPGAAETAKNGATALTVPLGAWVCWVPFALPAAVLKNMRSSICGYCQYRGATSITTKYWLNGLNMVDTVRWPNASYSVLSIWFGSKP